MRAQTVSPLFQQGNIVLFLGKFAMLLHSARSARLPAAGWWRERERDGEEKRERGRERKQERE
jgi:hypothetical protein